MVFDLPLPTPDRMETTLASGEFGWQDRYVYSGGSSPEAFQGVRLELCSRELPYIVPRLGTVPFGCCHQNTTICGGKASPRVADNRAIETALQCLLRLLRLRSRLPQGLTVNGGSPS